MLIDINFAIYIVLFLLPIALFVFCNKKINRHFMKQQLTVKLADLLVPYLIVGIHIISSLTWGRSIFPFFLIFIFTLAIILLLYLAVKKGEILYHKFFKSWWRFVFLSSILTYYGLIVTTIVASI